MRIVSVRPALAAATAGEGRLAAAALAAVPLSSFLMPAGWRVEGTRWGIHRCYAHTNTVGVRLHS